MGSKYPHIFEPIRIRGVQFKNRLELAPPSPNLASRDWKVTKEFVDFFRPFAKGGVGIIHVGNSIIDINESCDEERQLDLSTDDCILPLTRFVEMCHGYGCQPSLEINHGGKDSMRQRTGKRAYAPSSYISTRERTYAESIGEEPLPTIEMSLEKIKETIEKYAQAALRCKRAG
ncbi:MAG: NADH:flavin oxidoreductase, partial [Clostridiales bacterium]|nr:NADH:flavin oxidoreductase [Clostridiales bacterium]